MNKAKSEAGDGMSRIEDVYKPALVGKKLPILTLDNKWHRLFTQTEANSEITALEQELNDMLKRQGKLNHEVREIHKLKTRLMDEIVTLMPSSEKGADKKHEKKLSENRRLINECNEKLKSHEEELTDLPKEIDRINYELMLRTMEVCYEKIHENTQEIEEIGKWINQMRVELKKNVVRKQEKEINNQMLYSYMHDIFGASVIDLFDMSYNPEEQKIRHALPKDEIKKEEQDKKRN